MNRRHTVQQQKQQLRVSLSISLGLRDPLFFYLDYSVGWQSVCHVCSGFDSRALACPAAQSGCDVMLLRTYIVPHIFLLICAVHCCGSVSPDMQYIIIKALYKYKIFTFVIVILPLQLINLKFHNGPIGRFGLNASDMVLFFHNLSVEAYPSKIVAPFRVAPFI